MKKPVKAIKIATGILIGISIILIAVRFVSSNSHIKQLPAPPELNTLSGPLREQITSASLIVDRHPTAENFGKLGMVYHSGAFYEKAAACYKLAIKEKPSTWKWNYYLGYLYREMGESDASLKNFKKVLRRNPKINLAWFYIGEAYKNMGDSKQAEKAFKKIVHAPAQQMAIKSALRTDIFPLPVYANFQLARIYLDSKQPGQAKKSLEEIIKNYRTFGAAYRLLGNVYSMEGDQAQSEHFTVRANDLAVYSPPVDTLIDRLSLLSRSDLYLLKKVDEAEMSGYPEWAMRLMANGYPFMPDNKYLISKFIKLYLLMDFGNQASPLFEKHRILFHDDFNEISNVAYLLYNKGLHSQSLDYYRLARQIKPEDISTQTSIILCLWNSGSKKQAVDSTLRWLDYNPGNSSILKEGVGLLLNLKEEALTKVYFNKLKRMALQDPEVMALSGKIAEAEGNMAEAMKWYESAFRTKPEDLSHARLLVNMLAHQELWQKCITCLREALVYHPNEPFLLERLGTLLVSCPEAGLRNPDEGKEFSERAFIHTTSEPSILISSGRSLSMAYAMLGDRKKAYSTMQMTINLAKRERASKASIAELERLLKAFR